jgi:hypothetical protein
VGDKGLKPLVTTIGERKTNRFSITSKNDDRAQEPAIISIFLLLLKKIKSGAIARAYIPPSDFTQSPPRSPG